MGAAALPAGPSEHRGDGVLQPLVSIGGYQLHPGGAHVHTQDLTLPVGIDPRRHHHHDATLTMRLPTWPTLPPPFTGHRFTFRRKGTTSIGPSIFERSAEIY